MADWRIGRGWSDRELADRLAIARTLGRNYEERVEDMTRDRGWHQYFSEAVIARFEDDDDGADAFERTCTALTHYAFSDPRIVLAHFDADDALRGRAMLLELRAFRILRYLGAVVVGAVRDTRDDDCTVFGFRYDTLAGHIEKGAEWFLLTHDHEKRELRFRIEAAWQPGHFPNWWSRIGFSLVGPYYQRVWHHRAHARMARIARGDGPDPRPPRDGGLVHSPPDVLFQRYPATNA